MSREGEAPLTFLFGEAGHSCRVPPRAFRLPISTSRDPSRRPPLESFALAPVRRQFRHLARAIVPESADLDDEAWSRAEEIIGRALSERPPAMVRQLRLFIRIISMLSLLRFGRTFEHLDAERRRRLLHGLENSGILLLRRGFWGLRTLVFMGYYGLPEVRDSIGYRARPGGWSARA